MLSIAKATIKDIPLIRELTMQVWPQTYTPILGHEQVAYMLDRFYAPRELEKQMNELQHQFILCYSEESPVAFASFSRIDIDTFKLHKLYILPGRQGLGIGQFMLAHITGDLKKNGATVLQLNVNIYNKRAKAFYEKAGFVHLKDEDIDIGSGYFMNDHVLSLAL